MKEIDLYKQMMATAAHGDMAVIPKQKAAKLLALCFSYGDEPFVFNEKLRTDTLTASLLYGVMNGGCVDPEFRTLLNGYYDDIRNNRADWKTELEEEYSISFPEYEDVSICVPEGFDWKAGRRQPADRSGCPSETLGPDH